jgi:hypothetical protein
MTTNDRRVSQEGEIQFVRLGSMAIPPHAQRELKSQKVDAILANFDLDVFGLPVVSHRRGVYYVLDGQHRVEAMKQWLGKAWEDQRIECRVYEGLSEADEADKFDRLNDTMPVSGFDKFRIRVNANRETEVKIKKTVEAEGLRISRDEVPGAIQAVGTLRRVFVRAGDKALGKTLRIIRDSFGDAGFEAPVIDGIAHMVQRYDGLIDEKVAVGQLSTTHGGVKGLLNRAATLHKQTGGIKAHCVAAAAVDIINTKRGRKKLPSWWKTGEASSEAELPALGKASREHA